MNPPVFQQICYLRSFWLQRDFCLSVENNVTCELLVFQYFNRHAIGGSSGYKGKLVFQKRTRKFGYKASWYSLLLSVVKRILHTSSPTTYVYGSPPRMAVLPKEIHQILVMFIIGGSIIYDEWRMFWIKEYIKERPIPLFVTGLWQFCVIQFPVWCQSSVNFIVCPKRMQEF